jgi:hypothetical protein
MVAADLFIGGSEVDVDELRDVYGINVIHPIEQKDEYPENLEG